MKNIGAAYAKKFVSVVLLLSLLTRCEAQPSERMWITLELDFGKGDPSNWVPSDML
jgi:hypothetical protein